MSDIQRKSGANCHFLSLLDKDITHELFYVKLAGNRYGIKRGLIEMYFSVKYFESIIFLIPLKFSFSEIFVSATRKLKEINYF